MDVPQPIDQSPPAGDHTRTLLLGCLGVSLLAVIAVVILAIWLTRNVKRLGADYARDKIVVVIESSPMPAEERAELIVQVDRLTQGFKEGRVSLEKVGKVFERLGEGPLIHAAGVYIVQDKYVEPSDLADDEKESAQRTLQRLARGVFQKQVSQEELGKAMRPLMEKDETDGEWTLKESATTEEVRMFLDGALRLVDEKAVPDEAFEVNAAEEFRKAIDEALGEGK